MLITPSQIKEKSGKKYIPFLKAMLEGDTLFPLSIFAFFNITFARFRLTPLILARA